MRNRFALIAATAVLTLAGSTSPSFAHHSFAMFDPSKVVTLKGVVTEFDWSNPHVSLTVSVPGPGGAQEWSVELTSPGNLTRMGWNRHSVKPGDKVSVDVNPLRDGKHGGGFRKLTLVDTGVVLGGALTDLEKPNLK